MSEHEKHGHGQIKMFSGFVGSVRKSTSLQPPRVQETLTRETFLAWLSSLNFCWCGRPAAALLSLRSILQLHDGPNGNLSLPGIDALVPDEGTQYLILYWLDAQDLTEHGGSVGGAWLTDLGKSVLEFLSPLSDEEIDALVHSL